MSKMGYRTLQASWGSNRNQSSICVSQLNIMHYKHDAWASQKLRNTVPFSMKSGLNQKMLYYHFLNMYIAEWSRSLKSVLQSFSLMCNRETWLEMTSKNQSNQWICNYYWWSICFDRCRKYLGFMDKIWILIEFSKAKGMQWDMQTQKGVGQVEDIEQAMPKDHSSSLVVVLKE